MSDSDWRLCSSCKKPLPYGKVYYACSVSTCNRKKMPYTFCSVPCWDAHVPMMRHREAWAEERTAPTLEQFERELAQEQAKAEAQAQAPRRVVSAATSSGAAGAAAAKEPTPLPDVDETALPRDVLIVVSKLKKYVKERSGFNTSDNVMPVLSELVRRACARAIRNAAQDGRKTVLDRDFD